MAPEKAIWMNWRTGPQQTAPASFDRVYFGHETCAAALPDMAQAVRTAGAIRRLGMHATYVTPHLSDSDLSRQCAVAEALAEAVPDVEIVSSDWGFLHYLSHNRIASPALGRILAAQPADPRLRRILGMDGFAPGQDHAGRVGGTPCRIVKVLPGMDVVSHFQSVHYDHPHTLAFLLSNGIRRGEISNVAQGLDLAGCEGWSYSLHVNTLVAVMPRCPGTGENLATAPDCHGGECESETEWRLNSSVPAVKRVGNALYCGHACLGEHPCVDRIVWHRA